MFVYAPAASGHGMVGELLTISGSLLGVLIGALLAWWAANHQRRKEEEEEAFGLSAVLAGELKRISRHYQFVRAELPASDMSWPQAYPFELSTYGPIKSLEVGLIKLGFLDSAILERVMELNFLIRNADILFRDASAKYEIQDSGYRDRFIRNISVRCQNIISMADRIYADITKADAKTAPRQET